MTGGVAGCRRPAHVPVVFFSRFLPSYRLQKEQSPREAGILACLLRREKKNKKRAQQTQSLVKGVAITVAFLRYGTATKFAFVSDRLTRR